MYLFHEFELEMVAKCLAVLARKEVVMYNIEFHRDLRCNAFEESKEYNELISNMNLSTREIVRELMYNYYDSIYGVNLYG